MPLRAIAAERLARLFLVSGVALVSCGNPVAPQRPATLSEPPAGQLRAVSDFAGIADRDARAVALFNEASRVLLHPRCTNCHPSGDAPLQGDGGFVHEPPVTRGPDGDGVVGMECTSCHQDQNLALGRVPGAPNWHLAALSMAWVGKSPHEVCEQLKDPQRNGDKTVEQIVAHTEKDGLIAWGFAPGHGRTPAPGSQAAFGALMRAWAASGAACPSERAAP